MGAEQQREAIVYGETMVLTADQAIIISRGEGASASWAMEQIRLRHRRPDVRASRGRDQCRAFDACAARSAINWMNAGELNSARLTCWAMTRLPLSVKCTESV